jgi:MoxR-like ATPase
MSTKHPSTQTRDALRAFIRTHAAAETILKGRRIHLLTMAELWEAFAELGGDANALAAEPARNAAQDETQDAAQDNAPAPAPREDKSEAKQLATIRDLIMNGGFTAADPALRKLISDANKPAEIIEVVPGAARDVTHARQTTVDVAWSKLFGVKGQLGKNTTRMWDGAHPLTPVKDDSYIWPAAATAIALVNLSDNDNVFLFGPPGTGKTTWAKQFAAHTGRPFILISCDDQTDGPTLLGMTVPSPDGGTVWQDGILTKAIQTPGAIICIDEPSVARAGALMVLQNVLADRALYLSETGRRVNVAKGVLFISCDNTNGAGGGAAHGFTGTGRLNVATQDRFASFCYVGYLEEKQEAGLIARRTGCTLELATLLVGCATTTRAKAENGELQNGISLRRLFSWAKLLTAGIPPRAAFDAAVRNICPEQDREAITQQCLLSYDKAAVAKALNPGVAMPEANPTEAGRAAAEEFAS